MAQGKSQIRLEGSLSQHRTKQIYVSNTLIYFICDKNLMTPIFGKENYHRCFHSLKVMCFLIPTILSGEGNHTICPPKQDIFEKGEKWILPIS